MFTLFLFGFMMIVKVLAQINSTQLLPNTNMSMGDANSLLDALERGAQISYAHFNDGEINLIECKEGDVVDFGWQICSPKLSNIMLNALTNAASNFYLGLACACMWRGIPFIKTMKYLNITHNLPYSFENPPRSDKESCPPHPIIMNFSNSKINPNRLTVGTVFLNENYFEAKRRINKLLTDSVVRGTRGVHVIIGQHKNHTRLPFPTTSVHYVPKTNAFDAYEMMHSSNFLDLVGYRSGDIVLLMTGPLGRVLASEYSLIRQDISFLDMGSFWDEDFGDAQYIHGGSAFCMFAGDLNTNSNSNSKRFRYR